MRHILLSDLRRIADIRPAGYVEECLAAGQLFGDVLIISEGEYDRLRRKHNSSTVPKPSYCHVLDSILDKPARPAKALTNPS